MRRRSAHDRRILAIADASGRWPRVFVKSADPRRATAHRWKGRGAAAGLVTPSLGGRDEDEGTTEREHPGRVHRRGGRRAPLRHRGTRCADPQARAEARAGHHGRHARLRAVSLPLRERRDGDACKLSTVSNASYISLCCFAADAKGYVAERYVDPLPKAGIGKACVRFKKLADLDEKALVALIKETTKMGIVA